MKSLYPVIARSIIGSSIFLVIAVTACKKNGRTTELLPPATHAGNNIIGFMAGNDTWIPYARCGFFSNPCQALQAKFGKNGPDVFSVSTLRDRNGNRSFLTIHSQADIRVPGRYMDSLQVAFSTGNDGDFSLPMPAAATENFVVTHIDTLQQLISGYFSFTLKATNGSGKTLNITDGRFDLRFNVCRCSD